MFLFKKVLILNLLLCGLLTTTLQAKDEWEKFTPEDKNFSVEFPKAPEYVTQTIQIPKTDLNIQYDTYVSEPSDSVVYVTSVWHYPKEIDMTHPEINLQDGFSGMLQALPGSKVIDMQVGEVEGFKSLEFLVKNEDIYFQGKLILVYNTLYQVFTVYKESIAEQMKSDYKYFIDSFKIHHPEKNRIKTENVHQVNV